MDATVVKMGPDAQQGATLLSQLFEAQPALIVEPTTLTAAVAHTILTGANGLFVSADTVFDIDMSDNADADNQAQSDAAASGSKTGADTSANAQPDAGEGKNQATVGGKIERLRWLGLLPGGYSHGSSRSSSPQSSAPSSPERGKAAQRPTGVNAPPVTPTNVSPNHAGTAKSPPPQQQQQIQHKGAPVETSKRMFLEGLLNRRLKVLLSDERVIFGRLLCTDHDCNLIMVRVYACATPALHYTRTPCIAHRTSLAACCCILRGALYRPKH